MLRNEVADWDHRFNRDRTTIDWNFISKQVRRKRHYSIVRARY